MYLAMYKDCLKKKWRALFDTLAPGTCTFHCSFILSILFYIDGCTSTHCAKGVSFLHTSLSRSLKFQKHVSDTFICHYITFLLLTLIFLRHLSKIPIVIKTRTPLVDNLKE